MERWDFASDNVAGAMPEVMEALARFNGGFAAAYGEGDVCRRAGDLIRELLDADAEIWFAASGTAANALSLAALAAPHEAVLAHEHSHVATDETGAPAFFGGGLAIIGLAGGSAKIDPAALAGAFARPDDPHWQATAALSLTNATEYGAVYATEELAALVDAAKEKGLRVHIDGARLAYAVAAGFDPRALRTMDVDMLVMGGTKVGSTPTEAIVVLDKALNRRFAARLKHAGQLVSKARFLAAPWLGLLESGAWRARAAHANAMAARLAAAMPLPIVHPVQSNAVFVTMDKAAYRALGQAGWRIYRFADGSVRFMCSWATTPGAVNELVAVLDGLARTDQDISGARP